MKSQYEQLNLFLNSINEEAKKSTENIMREADELRTGELEKAKLEALQKSRDFIKYESEKLKTQSNCMVSKANKQLRKQLLEKRNGIADSVFEQVCEKINAFTKTEEYKSFLLESIKKFAEFYKGASFVLSVKNDDLSYKEFLMNSEKSIIRVEVNDDIVLGGCKAHCDSSNSELDDTLDARLESEKEWFYSNSDLTI